MFSTARSLATTHGLVTMGNDVDDFCLYWACFLRSLLLGTQDDGLFVIWPHDHMMGCLLVDG